MKTASDKQLDTPGLDRSELFERIVTSATGFAIFTTDSDGLITSWSLGAERMLGYDEAAIAGHSADLIFVPEDRAAGIPDLERVAARAKSSAEDERWHLRADGTRFWGSGLLMPLLKAPGGFVKVLRDLSDRHAAEMRLRESEELFRLLATNIPQLVFKTRGDGCRTWGSPQWTDFTGLTLEASVGHGWMDAVHPNDREPTAEAWSAAQRTGEYFVEHRIRDAGTGAYRWHQTRAKPIGGVNEVAAEWVGTSTDIHDLRELKDRQDVIMAELQHRTRNLLALVQSLATQASRRSASLQDFQAEFGGRLRALSRVQGQLARTGHHTFDLRTLIEDELIAHGEDQSRSAKLLIEGPDAAVPGEAAQALALAVHELATNAMKHGALLQPAAHLEVRWRKLPEDPAHVLLEWRESGVPMPDPEPVRRKGFGRELIERGLPYQLKTRTRFEFTDDGVHCDITVPVAVTGGEVDHG